MGRTFEQQRKYIICIFNIIFIIIIRIELFSVEQIFREANVHPNGRVNYDEFVKIACAPIPDYY